MLLRTAPRVIALSCFGLLACSGAAFAQRAPIVYAGQAGATHNGPAGADRLEGGSETSYGYGAQNQRQGGAVIDLRRPASGERPRVTEVAERQPVSRSGSPEEGAATNVRTEEGSEPWLERERVGPPYQANGRWYVPTPEPGYAQTGTASWYGPQFHGQRTASGEVFDETALTAAHPTLPIPSLVQVTNLENGREVIVRVNDRGPFVDERLIDLSRGAAQVLGFEQQGRTRVHVRYLGPAPRHVNAETAMAAAAPSSGSQSPPARADESGPRSLLPPPASLQDSQLAAAAQSLNNGAERNALVGGGYYVQVGAFSDLSNAHRVRDAIADAGPVVVDVRRSASGTELFRVRVGPWNSEGEADAARRRLAAMGYGETILAAR